MFLRQAVLRFITKSFSSRLSSLGKRVQKYALLVYNPNILNYFFEVFLKESAKALKDNDVVEHIFKRRCGRARKDIHYIYTCARRARRKRIKTFYKHAGLGGGGSVSIVAASKQGHCFTHSSGSISPLWFRSGLRSR